MLSEESTGSQILIALEGPDYTGKSTLVEKLVPLINQDYASHRPYPVCTSFSRPGGTPVCDMYRDIIVGEGGISSTTRQAIALLEDAMFYQTMETPSPIVLLDRYNPISGQVYGPPEFREVWRLATVQRMVTRVDGVIIIESSKETILRRAAARDKRDAMDEIFASKIDKYLDRYTMLHTDTWLHNFCNPYFITNNDDDFDGLLTKVYRSIKEIIDERIDTIGL